MIKIFKGRKLLNNFFVVLVVVEIFACYSSDQLVSQLRGTNTGILFTYQDLNASSVQLIGDFNNWNTPGIAMKRDVTGTWSVVYKLGKGKYEYKFLVDGQYVTDPENPVTGGSYGNSILVVDSSGMPEEISSVEIEPINANLGFNGDFRSQCIFLKDSFEHGNPYRMQETFNDMKLDLVGSVSNKINTWTRLRASSTNGEFTKVDLERSQLHMYNDFLSAIVFYNVNGNKEFSFDDPRKILASRNEYHDNFGRNEQGIYVERIKIPMGLAGSMVMSNNISDDDDILAFRASKKIRSFSLGSTFLREDLHSVDITPPGSYSGSLYARDYLYGFDLKSYELPWNSEISGEFLKGRKDLQNSEGDKWLASSKNVFLSGFLCNPLTWFNAGINFETEDIKLPDFRGSYKVKFDRTSIKLNLGVPYFTMNYLMVHTYSRALENTPWMILSEYSRVSELGVYESILLGYKHRYISSITLTGESQDFRGVHATISAHFGQHSLKSAPAFAIFNQCLEYSLKRWEFKNDLRIASYNIPYFDIRKTYTDIFWIFSYKFTNKVKVSLKSGYDPYTFDDEFRNREDLLQQNGFSPDIAYYDYESLGKGILNGEDILSGKKIFMIEGRIIF